MYCDLASQYLYSGFCQQYKHLSLVLLLSIITDIQKRLSDQYKGFDSETILKFLITASISTIMVTPPLAPNWT